MLRDRNDLIRALGLNESSGRSLRSLLTEKEKVELTKEIENFSENFRGAFWHSIGYINIHSESDEKWVENYVQCVIPCIKYLFVQENKYKSTSFLEEEAQKAINKMNSLVNRGYENEADHLELKKSIHSCLSEIHKLFKEDFIHCLLFIYGIDDMDKKQNISVITLTLYNSLPSYLVRELENNRYDLRFMHKEDQSLLFNLLVKEMDCFIFDEREKGPGFPTSEEKNIVMLLDIDLSSYS